MTELSTRIVSLLFVTVAVATAACGDDDEEPATLAGGAQRGESCRARADCAPGLSCMGGSCSVRDFLLPPINTECVSVECRTAEDCCPVPPAICATYKANCDAGVTSYCDLYASTCVCTADEWACENDLCQERCTTSSDCSTGDACVDSRCAECATDTECLTTEVCKNQRCEPKCVTNDECQYFHDCIEGTCVDVGCKTDRECQAAVSNVLATCVGGECKTPCQSDVECDRPRQYGHSACIGGFCIDIGCESDEECRILLDVQAGRGVDAVCRERTAP